MISCPEKVLPPLKMSTAYDRNENDNLLEKASPIIDAVHIGDLECLRQILTENENLQLIQTIQDENGLNMLHHCVLGGSFQCTKLLLDSLDDQGRANVIDASDKDGRSPIHWAVACSQVKILQTLLERGGNPIKPDNYGITAVHYTTQLCKPHARHCINALLGSVPGNDIKYAVNAKDSHGRTPLLWAVSAGNCDVSIIDLLIKNDADVCSQDDSGLSALHCAATRGNVQVVCALCDADERVLTLRDKNGLSPLQCAAALGHCDVCRAMLQVRHALANCQDAKGTTAAHAAAATGQLQVLKLLHTYGASLHMQNHRGDLPIHEAVHGGYLATIQYLLHASPEGCAASNHSGRTCMHLAAAAGMVPAAKLIVKCMRQCGLDVRQAVNVPMVFAGNLSTPLDIANCRHHLEMGDYLKSLGAISSADFEPDINAQMLDELRTRMASSHGYSGRRNNVNLAGPMTSNFTSPNSVQSQHTNTNTSSENDRILGVKMPLENSGQNAIKLNNLAHGQSQFLNAREKKDVGTNTVNEVAVNTEVWVADEEVLTKENHDASKSKVGFKKSKKKAKKEEVPVDIDVLSHSGSLPTSARLRKLLSTKKDISMADILTALADLKQCQKTGSKNKQIVKVRKCVKEFMQQQNLEAELAPQFHTFAAWEKFLYDILLDLYNKNEDGSYDTKLLGNDDILHRPTGIFDQNLFKNSSRIQYVVKTYGSKNK